MCAFLGAQLSNIGVRFKDLNQAETSGFLF
jgi:hypothetical protein